MWEKGETGGDAARLAPHNLPGAVHVKEFAGADRHRIQSRDEAKGREFLDGMRQGVDADPEFADFGSLLVDLAADAALGQPLGPGSGAGRRHPAAQPDHAARQQAL